MNNLKPFVVGKKYITNAGNVVTCLELTHLRGYECARFDDPLTPKGGWRYNRDSDRGRVTGSAFYHSDPRCIKGEA